MSPRTERRVLGTLLAAFVLLGALYSAVNPLFEATDELRHYRFVRAIAEDVRLPVQGEERCRSQSHHPPLFYIVGALATGWIDTGRDLCYTPPQNPFWAYRYFDVGVDNKSQYLHGADEAFPWSGMALAAHIVRLINVLVGAGTVWLTWSLGRAVWPERPAVALGGAVLVAFNPMFLYMSGAINNDVLAAFSGTAVLLACVRLVRDPAGLRPRWGVVLGALYSVALLSKLNLAPWGVLVAAAVTLVARREGDWRAWWGVGLRAALTTAVLTGWWFVRNQLLYGEPTGFVILTELWGVRDAGSSIGLALSELPYAWSTLWGRFGFGQIPLPQWIYSGLAWVTVAGLVGWVGVGRDRWTRQLSEGVVLLGATVVIAFAVLFNYMLVSPAGAMGRFFFPGLPALALIVFYGLASGLGALVRARWTAVGVTLAMALLSLVALFGYLRPAYARPPAWPAGATLPNATRLQFDSLVVLRGYEVAPETLAPGQPLDVTLYWEVIGQPPGDYLLFIHLLDGAGTMVAQRDTHPGLGRFPSRLWQPGDRFVETVRLYVPETAYTPERAALSIGLYAPGAYRLGVVGSDGEGMGDAVTLAEGIALRPVAAGEVPNPIKRNFGNDVALTGYAYDRRRARPGETMTVTFYWEGLRPMAREYEVQVRLIDEAGQERAAGDGRIEPPTTTWTPGERVVDTYRLTLPGDLAPGRYGLRLSLVEPGSGGVVDIVAEDGHLINPLLNLAEIHIES